MIITTISRPDLTEEERAKRMEAIKKAAVELVIATERKKGSKKCSTKESTETVSPSP